MGPSALALMEPHWAVNVGHVARVMANFGVDRLYLIGGDVDLEEARPYASHGAHILDAAKSLSLQELRKEFPLLVGSTAIAGRRGGNIIRANLSLVEARERLQGIKDYCLLLGREGSGLSNEELALCDLVITIPTPTSYWTLNISHATAIMLYELTKERVPLRRVAGLEERRIAQAFAIELARRVGYPKHRLHLLEEALGRLLGESLPSSREVSLLIGLFRKALKALPSTSA